jgi:hypothetical protein
LGADLRSCTYLRAIAALALECADKPWLWPLFLRVLAMVPGTMRGLAESRANEADRGVGIICCASFREALTTSKNP